MQLSCKIDRLWLDIVLGQGTTSLIVYFISPLLLPERRRVEFSSFPPLESGWD